MIIEEPIFFKIICKYTKNNIIKYKSIKIKIPINFLRE